jgi:hypothetical protein
MDGNTFSQLVRLAGGWCVDIDLCREKYYWSVINV